jgi:hopanoid biosynthesis associated protein HpnK
LKRLIVTADDFGLADEVNEAVEQAHLYGVLSSASLMVGAPAAADAVARARRMPRLRVGLHLTLVESTPLLPSADIPDLVDESGRLRRDLAGYGAAIMFRPSVRRQLGAEIRAQFQAYRATGLALDHVNAHQHYHLHPAVMGELLEIGRDFGMNALRAPFEPVSGLAAVERTPRSAASIIAGPWARLMLRRARRAGLVVADRVFGLAWSGAMTEPRLSGLFETLGPGCTEIYTHPATASGFLGSAPNYRYAEEFRALLSPVCRDALVRSGAAPGGYGDLASGD